MSLLSIGHKPEKKERPTNMINAQNMFSLIQSRRLNAVPFP